MSIKNIDATLMKNNANVKQETASLLIDFYGGLLTGRRAETFKYYYEDNLSLTEIALEMGISKQAVSVTLKKTLALLQRFENELHLIEKHKAFTSALANIDGRIAALRKGDEEDAEAIEKGLTEAKKFIAGLEI